MELVFKIIIVILLIKCFNQIENFFGTVISKTKQISGFESLSNNKKKKKIKVIWFHTETCPHCINMSSSWYELSKMYKNDTKKNKLFELIKIDVSKTNYNDMLKYYDTRIKPDHCMKGVPNVVLFNIDNKDYVYMGDRSETDMDSWIRITTNNINI